MCIKICGITSFEDALAAVRCGATRLGFVFDRNSPRFIGDDARLLASLTKLSDHFELDGSRKAQVRCIAVFNEWTEEFDRWMAPFWAVQYVTNGRAAKPPKLRQFPVIRTRDAGCVAEAIELFKTAEVGAVVVDAFHPDKGGGSGQLADWQLAKDILWAAGMGWSTVLAGGLTPDNVADAMSATGITDVDVSTGVESRPGKKDLSKMRAFVSAAKAARKAMHGAIGTRPVQCEFSCANPGWFGQFGGQYVPETLIPALHELESAFKEALNDEKFQRALSNQLHHYAGRPTALSYLDRVSQDVGFHVWAKREDLAHTGAHKINNALGQVLLARRMGKERIIAETGAGQHGVATATVCALYGLKCDVYMGTEDMERQALNVFRMRLLGANVIPVTGGTATLKDATSEAIRDWVTNVRHTHYVIGSCVGPHPYPMMVRAFQSIIGRETMLQMRTEARRHPDALIACVGGGSNAIGFFHPWLDDLDVQFIGVEAAGKGIDTNEHCATLTTGSPGVLHGSQSYVLQDAHGQIRATHSISAGLDYPGVGPEHGMLRDTGRARYVAVTDDEALEAFQWLARLEGLIPALESSHAFAYLRKLRGQFDMRSNVCVCLSGRGDKDMETARKALVGI